ncbi:hypothetical protein REPUB_Repub08aG0231800 [Reevesia pubescens]
MSMGGRLVLMKVILESLPLYYMSLFKLSRCVSEKLDKLQRRFLWGDSSKGQKIHLIDWKSLCTFKEFGGLGLVDLKLKNRALLNKWAWRYSKENESFWRSVIDSKYGGDDSLILPFYGHARNFSWLWKNISLPLFSNDSCSSVFSSNLCFSLGNGNRIRFWVDEGVENVILRERFPRIYSLAINKDGVVKDFGCWSNNFWNWNVPLRRNVFDWELEQWHAFLCTISE